MASANPGSSRAEASGTNPKLLVLQTISQSSLFSYQGECCDGRPVDGARSQECRPGSEVTCLISFDGRSITIEPMCPGLEYNMPVLHEPSVPLPIRACGTLTDSTNVSAPLTLPYRSCLAWDEVAPDFPN